MDPNALVVCVPNFSEGRRVGVIDAICDALSSVPGARLVYRQADAEHNRLDTTIVGAPDTVQRAALAGAAKAVELIGWDGRSRRSSRTNWTSPCTCTTEPRCRRNERASPRSGVASTRACARPSRVVNASPTSD